MEPIGVDRDRGLLTPRTYAAVVLGVLLIAGTIAFTVPIDGNLPQRTGFATQVRSMRLPICLRLLDPPLWDRRDYVVALLGDSISSRGFAIKRVETPGPRKMTVPVPRDALNGTLKWWRPAGADSVDLFSWHGEVFRVPLSSTAADTLIGRDGRQRYASLIDMALRRGPIPVRMIRVACSRLANED